MTFKRKIKQATVDSGRDKPGNSKNIQSKLGQAFGLKPKATKISREDMLKEALEALSSSEEEKEDSNLGDWEDGFGDNMKLHMMVVNKKNAHKINLAK